MPGLPARLRSIAYCTGATVCARLEEKGLLERKVIPTNRRQRALTITRAGQQLLDDMIPGAQRLRRRLLAPLTSEEQLKFMELLTKLVQENNEQSRAPLTAPAGGSASAATAGSAPDALLSMTMRE